MRKKPRAMGQGMFDWASTSPGRVDPRTGRLVDERSFFGPPAPPPPLAPPAYAPPRFARSYASREPYNAPEPPPMQREPGMFSWVSQGQSGRMSGPGGSSAMWLVGLSIVVGAGVMIALEATGVTNITGSAPKA